MFSTAGVWFVHVHAHVWLKKLPYTRKLNRQQKEKYLVYDIKLYFVNKGPVEQMHQNGKTARHQTI